MHAPLQSGVTMRNVICVVETGGVRHCHVGDNRAGFATDALERFGGIGVLLLPADDSAHLVDFGEVEALIERLGPRVVIPNRQFMEGLTHEDPALLPIAG